MKAVREMPAALRTTRGPRERLFEACDVLERAIASPTRDDRGAWADGVTRATDALSSALEEHVQVTEGDGGLFEDVIRHAPRVGHLVERLRHEHASFPVALTRLRSAASMRRLSREDVEGIRERAIILLGALMRHRHRGADLLYEAYWVDIEGGD